MRQNAQIEMALVESDTVGLNLATVRVDPTLSGLGVEVGAKAVGIVNHTFVFNLFTAAAAATLANRLPFGTAGLESVHGVQA